MSIHGNKYGMLNAVHMAANMANPETGALGDVLGSSPNGMDTSTLDTFNSLANIVAFCVETEIGCEELFDATTLPGGARPASVLQAVANIAKYSWLNVDALFGLSKLKEIYGPPVRSEIPDAWALFLKFTGTDTSEQTSDDLMNGPGAFAIDEKGFLWMNDNYVPEDRDDVARGSPVAEILSVGRKLPWLALFQRWPLGCGFWHLA